MAQSCLIRRSTLISHLCGHRRITRPVVVTGREVGERGAEVEIAVEALAWIVIDHDLIACCVALSLSLFLPGHSFLMPQRYGEITALVPFPGHVSPAAQKIHFAPPAGRHCRRL